MIRNNIPTKKKCCGTASAGTPPAEVNAQTKVTVTLTMRGVTVLNISVCVQFSGFFPHNKIVQ